MGGFWEDQQPAHGGPWDSRVRPVRTTKGVQVRGLRKAAAVASVTVLAVLGSVLSTAPAQADHGQGGGRHPVGAYPSQDQVDAARATAAGKAHAVAVIKTRLLLAQQQLVASQTAAEQAAEAYNGALYRLQQATDRLTAARADAARAKATVAKQRDHIGALVAASYQQGGDLTALNAMMTADGPEGVLDQYAAFQGASTSMQADYQRFAAADSLATVFARKAEAARADQQKMADKAKDARDAAGAAAKAAADAADRIATEKTRLITELARAQDISVSLARKRQAALEEIARRRTEERARRAAALAAAKAKAAAEAQARAEARRRAAAAAKAKADAARNAKTHHHATPQPPAPQPAPQPLSGPGPSPSGVEAAVSFAESQLGEPYLWGATGPDRWDCSGLTQGAWAAAGVYLPHYSVAQYDMGTPIPVSEARRGDLLFWTSNGSPSGIHHVALYLGDGDFIEAPHTGADVRYNSIYAWYPDYAVRL